jgi:hypothetical protein
VAELAEIKEQADPWRRSVIAVAAFAAAPLTRLDRPNQAHGVADDIGRPLSRPLVPWASGLGPFNQLVEIGDAILQPLDRVRRSERILSFSGLNENELSRQSGPHALPVGKEFVPIHSAKHGPGMPHVKRGGILLQFN